MAFPFKPDCSPHPTPLLHSSLLSPELHDPHLQGNEQIMVSRAAADGPRPTF